VVVMATIIPETLAGILMEVGGNFLPPRQPSI